MTTIIRNGTIVTPDLTYKADIAIESGTIGSSIDQAASEDPRRWPVSHSAKHMVSS